MSNTTRVRCIVDGFEDAWIDFRNPWTRKQTLQYIEDQDLDSIIATIAEQIAQCNIPTSSGVITNKQELLDADLDELDEVLVTWLPSTLPTFIGERRKLGNLSASVSSATKGVTVPTPKTPATETATA